ncbi:MAG: hypothetical protein HY329_07400 [Chloroflexi bacterium]|nr:hypothetical protein [Chloroflexota bacterium]
MERGSGRQGATLTAIGNALTRAADRAGLTEDELAAQLGTTVGVLRRLQHFPVPATAPELRRLAALFRLDPDRLAQVLEA